MAQDDWNVLAGRFTGDGGIQIIESELPMEIGSLDHNLSAPFIMSGTITNEVRRLKKFGEPVLQEWGTVLIAEHAGVIRGMSIYRRPTFNGAKWDLDQIGLPGYAMGMPFDGDASYVRADPLDVYRDFWTHLQGFPHSNLGLTIDGLKSPVRVGSEQEGDEENRDSGPRRFNWWSTLDVGKVIDDLARETPFDWRESYRWEGDEPRCHIELGYPVLGGRKRHHTLTLGVNLASVPSITREDFFDEVQVLGAGEGRDRIRGMARNTPARLRRVRTIDDKGIESYGLAHSTARDALVDQGAGWKVDTVEVFDHVNAPLAAIELGDELPLYAETDHVLFDQYVRVVGKSESPHEHDRATLTIVRPG